MSLEKELAAGIAQMGLEVTPEQQVKLLDYLALLQKWNGVYNLTAIRQPEQMVSNHLLDSLAVLPYLWPRRWLDVGCGGGLPGIVLAVMRPEWSFTLLDSNSKKIGFIQQAAIELDLQNVEVRCERVEQWQVQQKFDGIISRAFAEVADFVRLSRHLLKDDGRWAAMKGAPEQELARLPDGIKVEKVITLQVPKLKAARSLVVLGVEK
ncbi:16S rRNA (guanine(527)-N(7))-methyltransferase RsmG [Sideroxydans lithotrophicus]|uniref:Ribosomal RNA small subunit methyltransferase G n=1 Tax=Sideroxydans lithotrophicus (strain ES-1) TaxID=580332 RepID=D5CQJ5_SIDLE|nr:16S rRNA (guanine(527)-N(7))-methyltransferase RsmG [Sideroxydans lithotrophicus]ADE13216.1 methyltransferase GidB [Sideroxydans lithotrophicus ES-1]